MKLAMNVAANGDRRIDGDDIALFDQELTRLVAEFANLRFGDQAAGPQLLDRPVGRGLKKRGSDTRITMREVEIQVLPV